MSPWISETFQLSWSLSSDTDGLDLKNAREGSVTDSGVRLGLSPLTLMKFSTITHLREFYCMSEEKKKSNSTPKPQVRKTSSKIKLHLNSKTVEHFNSVKNIKGTINSVLWKVPRAPLPRKEIFTYKDIPWLKSKKETSDFIIDKNVLGWMTHWHEYPLYWELNTGPGRCQGSALWLSLILMGFNSQYNANS